MEIGIEWFSDQFNVNLSSKPGAEAFLSIKACRIVNGKDGAFVGWPATKGNNDKWWRHVWGSDKFNQAVLERALATKPASGNRRQQDDQDIPF